MAVFDRLSCLPIVVPVYTESGNHIVRFRREQVGGEYAFNGDALNAKYRWDRRAGGSMYGTMYNIGRFRIEQVGGGMHQTEIITRGVQTRP